MSRRFFSSIMILLPAGLVVLLSVIVTQWGARNSDSSNLSSLHARDGVWADIATFPASYSPQLPAPTR